MKKLIFVIPILAILLALTSVSAATSLVKRLSGRLVLQVESSGQMWYIDPATLKAIFVGSQHDVDRLKTEFAVPVSDQDLNRIAFKGYSDKDYSYAKSMSGKILLQSSTGKLWYVSPIGYKKYELGTGTEVITALHSEAIGISQKNFALLPQGACSKDLYSCSNWSICDQSLVQNRTCEKVFDCSTVVTSAPVTSQTCTWTPPTCTTVDYTDWSGCYNGKRERAISSKSPANCVGGTIEPLVETCLWVDANALPIVDGVRIGLQTTKFADYVIEIFDAGKLIAAQSGDLEFYNYYYQFEFNKLTQGKILNYTVTVTDPDTGAKAFRSGSFIVLTAPDETSPQYNIAEWHDEEGAKSCYNCVVLKNNSEEQASSNVTWKLYSTENDFTNNPDEVISITNEQPAMYSVLLPYHESWTVSNQSETFSGDTYVNWADVDFNTRYYWSAIVEWEDGKGSHYVDLGWDQDRTIFYQSYHP